jgi:DnaK suppressor protein
MLDEAKRTQLRQQLLQENQRLETQIERENQEILDMTRDQMAESSYGIHLADAGGHLQDIDRTSTVMRNLQDKLRRIKVALQRMDDGSYGLSSVSGQPIPLERLEVLPWATTLVDEQVLSTSNYYLSH